MSPAASLIYAAANQPAMEGGTIGACRTCGQSGIGLPFDAWVRDTFTDQDKLKPGEIICRACQFSFTDRNEPLAKLLGKDQPQRMRNYSHFVFHGQWIPLSKGEKPRMRDLLMKSPELAVIADSGQKHIIFRARPGWWQLEEQPVRPNPAALDLLLRQIEALYREFAKREIASGRYPQHRILHFGYEPWRRLEAAIRPARGSIHFELALFLAQKEDADDDESHD